MLTADTGVGVVFGATGTVRVTGVPTGFAFTTVSFFVESGVSIPFASDRESAV
ncbi:hypothetical protein D3C71_1706610 [compost metagenome]